MKWKITAMIETTNQYTYCHGKKNGISHGLVFQPTSGAEAKRHCDFLQRPHGGRHGNSPV